MKVDLFSLFWSAFLLIALLAMMLSTTAEAHDGHVHKAPWQACETKQLSNACSYENGNGDLFRGSCQLFTGTLMCVRNQPIVKAGAEVESNCSLFGWVLPKTFCRSADSQ